ncbi:MAG: hypothetical protein H7X99_02190, partial [Saprospiraceae bacterium]|nr:hypothetical protein [Saprospiraceae bacterium]
EKTITQQTFRRDTTSLQWLLKFTWVISAPVKDEMARKYHFTSIEKHFETVGIKIINDKDLLTSFIIITNRNGHMRLPYCFHNGDLEGIKKTLQYLIVLFRIHTFTLYNPELILYLKENTLINSISKPVGRSFLMSTGMANEIKITHPVIQDGDGDCAFT